MIGPEPLCMKCRHLFENSPGQYGFRCAAFPHGIPEEILSGEVKHTRPYPGDNGIRFEAAE